MTLTNLKNEKTTLVEDHSGESDLLCWYAQAPQAMAPLKIGPWLVQPTKNLLVRDDIQKKVGRKVMELLLFLASRAGDIVEKREIMAAVWEKYHVSDMTLTVTVSQLRSALEDNARAPIFLKTISGVGYKFMQAPVVMAPPQNQVEKKVPRPWGRQWFGFAGFLFVALLLVLAVWFGNDLGISSTSKAAQAEASASILERERLRIINLTQSEEGSYFVALMRQEILDALKETPLTHGEVRIEGALLSAAPEWCWRLQVIQVATGHVLWACESKTQPMGLVRYLSDWQENFGAM